MKDGSDSYYLCMSGNADESPVHEDLGEWRIIVEKKRSLLQRLSGKGKISAHDKMATLIEKILSTEPGIQDIYHEA